MSFEPVFKEVNTNQLAAELAVLNLSGYVGVASLSRRRNEDGSVESVAPYIVVNCAKVTAAKKEAALKVIADHVPMPDVPLVDPRNAKIDGMGISPDDKSTLKEVLGIK